MVLASAIGLWLVRCEGLPFCIIKLLDWFSMKREFVSVYNNGGKIDRVIYGSEGAYF